MSIRTGWASRTALVTEAAGHRPASQVPEPAIARQLVADTRLAPLWLLLRLYIGYAWLQSGYHKLTDPTGAWVGDRAGDALRGLVAGALAGLAFLRRGSSRRRERVDRYYADGSMVSLGDGSPDAERLLALGRDALRAARP